ncbi:MAG: 6-carboxytetrahydropterin synthase [Ornithinimicrobium sp.]
MFSLTVQDHMMVAHSLPDPFFGPAQNLHGATYVVQVRLSAAELDEHGVVIDIGAAAQHLGTIVADLSYRNLDDHPSFQGVLTTTEVLAQYVAHQMADAIANTDRGADSQTARRLESVDVTLHEHPAACASYHLALPRHGGGHQILPGG